jgi:hypothetical protein
VRGLWISLAVVASLRLLSLGSSGLGVLMAAAGVGALVAIFAAVLLVGNGRLANWFALGLLLCGLPIAAVGLAGSAAPAIVLMVVWGVGMSLSDVGAQTLLNRIVPAASIGRVTGAMESGKLVFEGFGSLIAPALLVGFGVRGALFAAGGVLPVAVLLGSRGLARIDDRAVGRVEILELLRRVPFFVPLRLDALEGVASRLQTELHPAGTEVVRQGEPDAHRWYLVDAGELVVEVDGFLVGELRRGDQFGERGLLRGVPRSATVRTVSDVVSTHSSATISSPPSPAPIWMKPSTSCCQSTPSASSRRSRSPAHRCYTGSVRPRSTTSVATRASTTSRPEPRSSSAARATTPTTSCSAAARRS